MEKQRESCRTFPHLHRSESVVDTGSRLARNQQVRSHTERVRHYVHNIQPITDLVEKLLESVVHFEVLNIKLYREYSLSLVSRSLGDEIGS